MSHIRLLAIALVCTAPLGAAQAQKLSPGLWEMSTEVKSSGGEMEAGMARMQSELAKMSPEQRKQMEAMMAGRGISMPGAGGNGPGGMTVKSCLGKEQAERGEPPEGDEQRGCKRETVQRSGNTLKFKFSCSNPPSSGEGEFTFTSDKAYTGRLVTTSERKGKPMQMEMKHNGRWLGADCGTLKPVQR